MKLADCKALAELDYFELNDKDQLVLVPGVADKIIDFHTHLGVNYLFASPVDIDREDDDVPTFFPQRGNPLDMEVYASASYTEESRRFAARETIKQGYAREGIFKKHSARNLLNEMDRNLVENSVILAIDFPIGPFSRTSDLFLRASRKYPRLIPFVSVHPYDPFMEKKVRKLRAAGGVGMKIHPAMQLVRANNKRAMALARLCGELEMPCLYHTGGSDIAPKWQQDTPHIKYFREPAAAMPEVTFIMGHSGIHYYKDAIALAVKHKNVFLELSGQPACRIREMLDAGLEDQLLFGSDWPYYVISYPLAKVLLATEGSPETRKKIIYDNARALLDRFGVSRTPADFAS